MNTIRRKLSYITLIPAIHNKSKLTNKQKNISNKVKKICGKLNATSLQSKLLLYCFFSDAKHPRRG